MGKNLVTRAEYKAYAGITSPNQDAEIDLLIPKASQLVKSYCRTSFVDNVDDPKVEQFSGNNYNRYYLKEYPVIQVLDVEASVDYGQTYTSLAEFTDWAYLPDLQAIQHLGAGWADRVNGYRVTYTCGYETVPEDLKLAVMDLITYYRRNDSAVHNSKVSSSGNVQIEYLKAASFPAHIRRVLDLYVVDFV